MDEAKLIRDRERQRVWRRANPEKSRAMVKAWAKANPEKKRERDRRFAAKRRELLAPEREARRAAKKAATKERQRAKSRERYLSNREAVLACGKAWRAANPERQAGLVKAWKDRNPEKVRADRRGRKIAKRKEIRAALTRAQRGKCAICRERLGADSHLDHIMPKKLGGSNARSNLQLTCPTCNLTKNAQHPIDHARSLGRLL